MKTIFVASALILTTFSSFSQWTNSGNNYTTGKLGIGFSTTPSFSLDIQAPTPFGGLQVFQAQGKFVRLYAPGMTAGAFNNTTANGDAGIVFGSFAGMNTTDYGFVIVPHRSSFGGLRITPAGDVGIGVSDTKGYRLAIGGKAIAEEIVVKLQGSWPDYVFKEQYDMPSLEELERYIRANNRLPEMPSASQVEETGISLGEMNTLLVKKVEELTLYIIELKKEIEALKGDRTTSK